MDAKEGMILGELKAFRNYATQELRELKDEVGDIKKTVDALDKFKFRVTVSMIMLLGTIEFCFRLYEVTHK